MDIANNDAAPVITLANLTEALCKTAEQARLISWMTYTSACDYVKDRDGGITADARTLEVSSAELVCARLNARKGGV